MRTSSDPDAQAAALSLGLSRAQAVANALVADGVPATAVRVGAEAGGRGAQRASGTNRTTRFRKADHVHRLPSGEFHRIRRLPPYVFAEVNTAKAKARAAGEDIIDLGMGNPDSPTPPHIVAKLVEAVQDPRTHRYSVSKGIPGLRRALAAYYARRFDVELDPETEVVATLGSKEGLANLASAITSPGDTILVPNPSYPIHQFGFIIAGAAVRSVPAEPGRGDAARAGPRGAALGAQADRADRQLPVQSDGVSGRPGFLSRDRRLRAAARDLGDVGPRLRGDLFRRQAAAVDPAGAGREGHRGRVHLAVEDLFDAGLAHGVRRGQCAADQRADADEVVSGLWRVHADPGRGHGGAERAAGLRGGDAGAVPRPARRADQGPGLGRLGRAVAGGSMFAWAPMPPRFASLGSVEFSKLLLARAKVAVAPGLGFGEHGEGFVRIALVENNHRLRQAVRNIRGFLQAGTNQAEPAEAAMS